ncbi:unnamed protein product [Staurois parvus]|uniref:Uncharacterized protein n=1 Tax=Staurois parvus TaxID=386267 RepID=A0ABN9AD56_9NEOB|nr:unnamed protein product [Staurois parvus]
MGPPTDPGTSGSARVSKWSVRPWFTTTSSKEHGYCVFGVFTFAHV